MRLLTNSEIYIKLLNFFLLSIIKEKFNRKNFNSKFVKKEDRSKIAFNLLTLAILANFNLSNLNLLCSLQS